MKYIFKIFGTSINEYTVESGIWSKINGVRTIVMRFSRNKKNNGLKINIGKERE